jgi:LmbE family N-acetylglucosaminyl deacetylase
MEKREELKDILLETDLVPYHAAPPPGERVMVLAPHPDDETLGCGGTINLLSQSGKDVKVVFLTSGDKADPLHEASQRKHGEEHITDYSLLREAEAEKALRILGISDYLFLRFPDRGLYGNYHRVLERIVKIMEAFSPDSVYSPSMVEVNPDHRTTAFIALELLRRQAPAHGQDIPSFSIVFYEVTTPLRPNIIVDISSIFGKKKEAVKRYQSQLGLIDYLRHITALNTLRSLTVKGPRYAEAFWCVKTPLTDEEISKWLSYQ